MIDFELRSAHGGPSRNESRLVIIECVVYILAVTFTASSKVSIHYFRKKKFLACYWAPGLTFKMGRVVIGEKKVFFEPP